MIFSIAIDADYSYEVKNSEIWASAFFKHNNSFIAAVNKMVAQLRDSGSKIVFEEVGVLNVEIVHIVFL